MDFCGRNPHILGQPGSAQVTNQLNHVFLGAAPHKKEVAGDGFQFRHFPPVDTVGIHNYQTFLRLAENLRQTNRRKASAAEHIIKRKAGAHRRKLVGVSHQNQPLSPGNGPEQTGQQQNIHHGHFVHYHHIAFQRIVLVLCKHHLSGGRVDTGFQESVNGGSILPCHLPQPLGRPTGGGCQKIAQLHIPQQIQNAPQDRCLTGAGAAGNQQQAGGCRLLDCLLLLPGVGQAALLGGSVDKGLQIFLLGKALGGKFPEPVGAVFLRLVQLGQVIYLNFGQCIRIYPAVLLGPPESLLHHLRLHGKKLGRGCN